MPDIGDRKPYPLSRPGTDVIPPRTGPGGLSAMPRTSNTADREGLLFGLGLDAGLAARQLQHVSRASTTRGLPLPTLNSRRDPDAATIWAVSPLGSNGRVPSRICLHELGWNPQTPLTASASPGLVIVTIHVSASRSPRLSARGHLYLSTTLQRVARFSTGQRLLLIADLDQRHLLIMAPTTLLALVADHGPFLTPRQVN